MEGNVRISNHCQRVKSIDQIDMMDLSEVETFKNMFLILLLFCHFAKTFKWPLSEYNKHYLTHQHLKGGHNAIVNQPLSVY